MSNPFLGEIRMFAGNFAPRGYAYCDGQVLAVSQNDALFSLLGTVYGGDGRTTFALPDLRGRIPIHPGAGPGLKPRKQGERAGDEKATLTTGHLASHTHDFNASTAAATGNAPQGKVVANSTPILMYRDVAQNQNMASGLVLNTGAGQPHNNMMPTLCIHFIIALAGVYPSRN